MWFNGFDAPIIAVTADIARSLEEVEQLLIETRETERLAIAEWLMALSENFPVSSKMLCQLLAKEIQSGDYQKGNPIL